VDVGLLALALGLVLVVLLGSASLRPYDAPELDPRPILPGGSALGVEAAAVFLIFTSMFWNLAFGLTEVLHARAPLRVTCNSARANTARFEKAH
jgi:hypothetical protein